MPRKNSAGFLFKLIQEAITRGVNQKLKPFGLTQSQGRVLRLLHDREGQKTSQKDIENYFEVSHPTVVGILKRLEAKGFVRCEFDGNDRRMKNVYLTEKEAEIHAEMRKFQRETEETLLDGLDENEKNRLLDLLRKVYENIR